MAGWAFAAALREAQQGRTEGFTALFRAHQPSLIRTLRGLAPDLADRAAAATWRQVVRDLASYSGDEYGFRVWLVTLGRIHLRALQQRAAEHAPAESPARIRRELRTLRFVSPLPTRRTREAPGRSGHPARPPGKGAPARWAWPLTTDEALLRVRELPADQAEAVLLRVVASLDVLTVADRVHRGSSDTRALYQRGLRTASRPRPGSPTLSGGPPGPLLLGPTASRIEALLDEPVFTAAGSAESRMAALVALLRAPATDDEVRGEAEALAAFTGTRGGRGLARARRRTAAIAVASVATTVMTITTAAAATGTLPTGLQQWAHTYVGAPEPPHELLAPLAQDTAGAKDSRPAEAAGSGTTPVATTRGSTRHTAHGAARSLEPPAGVAEPGPATATTTSPAADPMESTTPEPSAAPSVSGTPDGSTSPSASPTSSESGTPSPSPSGSGPVSPTETASPSSSAPGTPSGTPSASAATPTDTVSSATANSMSTGASSSSEAGSGEG
jgi:RNA polymerase sigma-70 factor (ECF subfamily)